MKLRLLELFLDDALCLLLALKPSPSPKEKKPQQEQNDGSYGTSYCSGDPSIAGQACACGN